MIPAESNQAAVSEDSTPIRVLVVDDHLAIRLGLIAIVNDEPGMRVVGEAGNGAEALAKVEELHPDIVLMDLRMPGIGGVEATLTIRRDHPESKVIILTTYDGDEDIFRALQSGAKAYLLKDFVKADFIAAIRAVHAGKHHLSGHVAERLAERLDKPELTAREMDVLCCLAKGRSNKEIARDLKIGDETVKFHLRSIFLKLSVGDRTQAVTQAIQRGLLHL